MDLHQNPLMNLSAAHGPFWGCRHLTLPHLWLKINTVVLVNPDSESNLVQIVGLFSMQSFSFSYSKLQYRFNFCILSPSYHQFHFNPSRQCRLWRMGCSPAAERLAYGSSAARIFSDSQWLWLVPWSAWWVLQTLTNLSRSLGALLGMFCRMSIHYHLQCTTMLCISGHAALQGPCPHPEDGRYCYDFVWSSCRCIYHDASFRVRTLFLCNLPFG